MGVNQIFSEKILTTLYGVCAAVGIIGSTTSGITWGHWRWTLDHCVRDRTDRNCSCILYAKSTPTQFLGGDSAWCEFASFGPIPLILICVVWALYHGFRACVGGSTRNESRVVTTKNEAGELILVHVRSEEVSRSPSKKYWIFASGLSFLMSIYALVYFSTFLGGYLQTCKEYRRVLQRDLQISGTAVKIIHSRLSCMSVLDFMDYLLQVEGTPARNGIIDTASALLTGIIASSFAVGAFIWAFIINMRILRAKRRQQQQPQHHQQ